MISRLRHKVFDRSLLSKLIIVCALVILVPTLIVSIVAARTLREAINREIVETRRQTVQQVASNINERVRVARNVAESIAYNTRIRSFFSRRFVMSPYSLRVYRDQIIPVLDQAVNFHTASIYRAGIYTMNESIPTRSHQIMSSSRVEHHGWFREFLDSEVERDYVYPNTADHFRPTGRVLDERPVLTWMQRIDGVGGDTVGIVTLDILESEIFLPLQEASGVHERYELVDEAGNTLYVPSSASVPSQDGAIRIREPLPILELWVQASFPAADAAGETGRAAWGMVASAVIGFVLSVALLYVVLKVMLRKLQGMLGVMQLVTEGDFSVRVPEGGTGEIDELSKDFNFLIDRINLLVSRVADEAKERQEAQLVALQSQINPHFIYNTIELFRMKMELSGDFDTADAITSFGKMVRYNMSGDSLYSSVEAELEHVRCFVGLQSIRYEDRIRLSVDCPDALLHHRMAKLILQPVVENCVLHGLPPGDDSVLEISIVVRAAGDKLSFGIRDNGRGMSPERLEQIRSELAAAAGTTPERRRSASGIALVNVAGRLRVFYGETGRIGIESEDGCGTTVRISVPLFSESDE